MPTTSTTKPESEVDGGSNVGKLLFTPKLLQIIDQLKNIDDEKSRLKLSREFETEWKERKSIAMKELHGALGCKSCQVQEDKQDAALEHSLQELEDKLAAVDWMELDKKPA